MTLKPQKFPLSEAPDQRLCAYASLRRAMRAVGQLYDGTLKPAGLKTTQFTLLAVVAGSEGMPITQLSGTLVMDRTTLTRNLKPLVDKGWIEIGRQEDERVRLVSATDLGRAKVGEATPMWREAQTQVRAKLGEDRLTSMMDNLDTLTETVRI